MRDNVVTRARRLLIDPRNTGYLVFLFCIVLVVSLWVALSVQLEVERGIHAQAYLSAAANPGGDATPGNVSIKPPNTGAGEPAATPLAAYHQRRRTYLWWAGAATAFILCFGFVAGSQLKRQARVNARLLQSEGRFRDLAELSSDWFWEQDASLRFTRLSDELYYKAVLNTAETIGKLRWELPIVGVSDAQWRAHRALLEHCRPFHDFVYQLRNAAGELRWLSINGKPLFGPAGEFAGYRGTGQDITERRLTEEARFQLAAIVESSRDAIISRTLDGTISSWNAGAERLLGYTAAEAVGRNITMIMPAGHEADATVHSRLLIEGGRIAPTEVLRRTKVGSLITVLRSISPVRNGAGEIVGAAIIMHDISARKRAESALARLNEELEERVAQRTVELRIAYEELESFSYSVSHDLRAPLRAINGFAAIVLREGSDKLDRNAVEHLQRIQANGQRMGELIDDMLNLTRVSRQEMRRQDFDFSALAGGAVAALAEAHPARRVQVTVQPGMRTHADRGLAQIVLENLLGNAWKFTANIDAATIEVGIERRESETTYYVRDNGAGFAMEYAHKLFVPFQRLHGSDEFEGTGIGLSIVKRIVSKHGGKVWAESASGQGATFYFTLG